MSNCENDNASDNTKAATEASGPKVVTFGCRLNIYESEVMKNHAVSMGLDDAIIVNTCAVTNEAERQGRQAIRKLKKENPNAKIIVTGCSAQINPDTYADMDEVFRVLGNHEKMQKQNFAPDLIEKVKVNDIMEVEETAHHLISGFEDHVRAFIQIQNGCNHRCTFCTIPYGRGNNRSVPMGDIVNQVKTLVENGCKEVVFTGVDITDYGQDLPGSPNLGSMIRRVLNNVPELQRLRLSSVDPAAVDDDVFEVLKNDKRLLAHMHISLQHGSDLILKRMKRRHLRKDIINFCEKVRSINSDAVFGCDIIAGFPTETDEHFKDSLSIIDECDITYLHVFPYSAKKGTPAARMPQVEGGLIKQRAAMLRQKGKERLLKYLSSQLNLPQRVLIEKGNVGHTEGFAKAKVVFGSTATDDKKGLQVGEIIKGVAKGIDYDDNSLIVEVV